MCTKGRCPTRTDRGMAEAVSASPFVAQLQTSFDCIRRSVSCTTEVLGRHLDSSVWQASFSKSYGYSVAYLFQAHGKRRFGIGSAKVRLQL
jgi:hypothetical protein